MKITRDASGYISVVSHHGANYSVLGVDEHPEIVQLTDPGHQTVVDFVTEPMAFTEDIWVAEDARRKDTPIIDLIQTVQKKATGAQLSAAAAFNTSVRFGPGAISRGNIALLYPFYNTLFKLEVTGEQIREYLEYSSRYYQTGSEEYSGPLMNRSWPGFNFDMLSGVDYTLDIRLPPGQRVTRLNYEGLPVSDDDRFTIALNSYRAEGGGGFTMIENAPVLKTVDRSVSELILEFLQEQEEISHDDVFIDNWHLVY